MCKHGTDTLVRVKVPADLSSTGEEKWREFGIDSCIAPIVKALQEGGIDMRGSCCGHGDATGRIDLADGRTLVILPPTVTMSLRYPLMTCHNPSPRCAVPEPHETANCGEFASHREPSTPTPESNG